MKNKGTRMESLLQILFYAGILIFMLWASAILKDVMRLDYSSFFRESPSVAAHNILRPLVEHFPAYFITAIIPATLLILSAVPGSAYEAARPQVKIQIILLAVIILTVGIVWDVVLISYAAIHTRKLWTFVFLSIDFLIVAVPLVLLLLSLPEARLSKAFLISLPLIVVASFLAKAAYVLSDFRFTF